MVTYDLSAPSKPVVCGENSISKMKHADLVSAIAGDSMGEYSTNK